MSKEAMKLAKAWFERNTYGDEAVDVYDALCAALTEQPAQPQQEPCDMENLCIGCSPRNADGSCPGEKPNGACDCYVKGFNDGMKELDQPAQQEPVAWRWINSKGWLTYGEASHDTFRSTPLYATPPAAQRTWVGLTEDDLVDVVPESNTPMSLGEAFVKYGKAIEAKLRSKNENSN